MKRLMISLLMLIGICAQGFAANLTGKWKTTINDDGKDMPCVLTIMEKDLIFSITISEDDEEMGIIAMLVDIPGNYTREGDKLNVNLNKKDLSLKLMEFKPKDEELKEMLKDEEAKKAIMALVEGAVSAYKDQMMGEEDFFGGELYIKSLTATTLTLTDDDGQDLVFTRVN